MIYNLKITANAVLAILIVFTTFALGVISGIFILSFLGATVSALLICDIKARKDWIPISILMLLVYQNVVIGVFGNIGFTNESLQLFTQIPFIYIVMIFLILLFEKKMVISNVFSKMLIFSLCIIASMINGSDLIEMIMQIRNLTVFYFAFEIIRYSITSEFLAYHFSRQFVLICITAAIIGIILLIGGFTLYSVMGIAKVYAAKGLPMEGVLELPGRFTTDVFNVHMSRMGGTYYEPVTFSYLMSSGTIVAVVSDWTSSRIKKVLTTLGLGICLLLTGGKGGMLVMLIIVVGAVTTELVSLVNSKGLTAGKFWLVVVVVLVLVSIFSVIYAKLFAGPAAAHFQTIEETWRTIIEHPLGHGLAQGGFNGEETDVYASGGESALMGIGFQLGIQGIITLGGVFVALSKYLLAIIGSNKVSGLKKYIVYLPIAIFGVSIFQLNTFTPQAIVPFIFVLGVMQLTREPVISRTEKSLGETAIS
ncbi:hypothetical protein [Lacticaseibacillus paracasei]|uniref:hypothetical protein n=1 Tax=Lacticaseibacillus paracasei TaxID=1597 RepID=UPI004046616F